MIKVKADWNFQGAEDDLRKAIELNPQNALTHYRLSQVLSPLGKHDEALAAIKRGYDLDPISETILVGHFPVLESRGEIAEGIKLAEKLLHDNKESPQLIRAYGTFLYHKGDFTKVIELGGDALANRPSLSYAWLSLIAASLHKTGQYEKRDAALSQLEILGQTDTKALYGLAMNYAEMERADDAIQALEKCYESREERMIWIKVEPRFANLRGDPRFGEIVRRMGLA